MSFNFRGSPTTPNRKGKSSISQAPSTTPAGNPPSWLTNKSTTPAGNPPKSSKIFGSSYNASNNTFGRRGYTSGRSDRGFTVPESSPPPPDEDDEDEDAEGEEVDEGYQTRTQKDIGMGNSTLMSSIGQGESPRGFKRSRDGVIREQDDRRIGDTARDMARNAGPSNLNDELDDVVLQTEDILGRLDVRVGSKQMSPPYSSKEETVASAAAQLTSIWSQHSRLKTMPGSIGPEAEDGPTFATYISSLLLQLHFPYRTDRSSFNPQRAVIRKDQGSDSMPIPQALLQWLNTYHLPLRDEFDEIHLNRPSPSAHDGFWDFLGAELLRGKLARVIRLLRDAGWEHAVTAQDDKCAGPQRGYHGKNLQNVEEVVGKFIRILESCPAVRDEKWDVRGPDWEVFRQRVRRAMKDLASFAIGSSRDEDDVLDDFGKSENIFAKTNGGFDSMAAASQRATSRVPHTIYETLKTLYGVMLGGDEIVDYAQDWLEATILFTVWWDGEERNDGLNSSLAGRTSMRKSKGPGLREVDVAPLVAYRKRLGDTFRNITSQIEESTFQPDTLDPIQVGLVCVIEDEVRATVELLRMWDPTVATAVVEVAALGGWLPLARPSSRGGLLQRGFSTEDLMVLSHGPPPSDSVDRDEILTSYADLLAGKDVFKSEDDQVEREGWELAVSVLGRLDDRHAAQEKISTIFEGMEFRDEARMDKVLKLCAGLGLDEQARGIAERYADTLASEPNSNHYGSALIFYARAHAMQKLKSTVSLLISLCLLQSAAIPTLESADTTLASLLSVKRQALVALAKVDTEAATLLAGQLSGYATMRTFYRLRDQNARGQNKGALERKRQAAKALIAIIESASDCIRGGLLDDSVESVVPIDGLLALLGEALPLLGQEKRIFTQQQVYALLRVVEDFDTAPGRIQEGAEGLLQASMNAYRGGSASNSRTSRKSKSNISGSSGSLSGSSWDMLASTTMLKSGESGGKDNKEEVHRGWDWRKGLDAVVGADVSSREVLSLSRTALAREVARGWGGMIIW